MFLAQSLWFGIMCQFCATVDVFSVRYINVIRSCRCISNKKYRYYVHIAYPLILLNFTTQILLINIFSLIFIKNKTFIFKTSIHLVNTIDLNLILLEISVVYRLLLLLNFFILLNMIIMNYYTLQFSTICYQNIKKNTTILSVNIFL